jgi:hypothetical protein
MPATAAGAGLRFPGAALPAGACHGASRRGVRRPDPDRGHAGQNPAQGLEALCQGASLAAAAVWLGRNAAHPGVLRHHRRISECGAGIARCGDLGAGVRFKSSRHRNRERGLGRTVFRNSRVGVRRGVVSRLRWSHKISSQAELVAAIQSLRSDKPPTLDGVAAFCLALSRVCVPGVLEPELEQAEHLSMNLATSSMANALINFSHRGKEQLP